jgi:hypothetical protein
MSAKAVLTINMSVYFIKKAFFLTAMESLPGKLQDGCDTSEIGEYMFFCAVSK